MSLFGEEFVSHLISAFDEATGRARQYFDQHGLPFCQVTAGTLVRQSVRAALFELGGVAFSEHEHGFVVERPFNLGLWIHFQGLALRAYKVPEGGTPLPGGSDARMRFLTNQEPLQRPLGTKPWLLNAAILWSLDAKGNIAAIRIVVPSGFDADGQLQLQIDHSLPTTVAELAQPVFVPAPEDDELLVVVRSETMPAEAIDEDE